MARKSEALRETEQELKELKDRIVQMHIDYQQRIKDVEQQCTAPYKELITEYLMLIKVVSTIAEDQLPTYVYQEMCRLIDIADGLLYPDKTEE